MVLKDEETNLGCRYWGISWFGTATGYLFCSGGKLQQLRHNSKPRRGCLVRCHHRLAVDKRKKVSAMCWVRDAKVRNLVALPLVGDGRLTAPDVSKILAVQGHCPP